MKKYIILSLIALITTMPDAWAKLYFGSSGRCIAKGNGAKEIFYYCGDQNKNCAGWTDGRRDTSYWLKHGQHMTDSYYCCSNKVKKVDKNALYDALTITVDGISMSYKDYRTKDPAPSAKDLEAARIVTKQLDGGGTCNYKIVYDVCGKDVSTVCTKPDNCTSGLFLRGETCVAPCPTGQAFDSPTSTTCIDCPTTNHGGPDEATGNCIKCHETNELFNYETGECKAKSKVTPQYSNAAFLACWQCGTQDDFKVCATYYSNPQTASTTPSTTTTVADVPQVDGTTKAMNFPASCIAKQ